MELENIIGSLRSKLAAVFGRDKTGHNIDHLERTMKNAVRLQRSEGGNLRVIAVSALLHDVHRIMTEDQRSFVSPKDSLPKVKELLAGLDLTEEEEEHICYAIEHHEEYSFGGGTVTVTDIESKILQDADNLDGAGAIGIGRTFVFGSAHGIPFYDESYPLAEGSYKEGGSFDPSTIHHCVNKLARLHQTMNTKTGREICEVRCGFVQAFVKEFLKEWSGEG